MPTPKHGANWLQDEVLEIVEQITTGEIELPEDRTATPHVIAKIVASRKGEEAPSTGAVAAVLHRWVKLGFITVHSKPLAFKGFTAAGRKHGLAGLREKARAKRSAERAAAKAEAEGDKPKAKKASAKKAAAKKVAKAKPESSKEASDEG